VYEFESSQIEPAPKIGTNLNTEFIWGMGKRVGEFIIILDIDKVFSSDEFSVMQQAELSAPDKINSPDNTESTPESSGT
jgi:purine-binding chemotaxis protein CheW